MREGETPEDRNNHRAAAGAFAERLSEMSILAASLYFRLGGSTKAEDRLGSIDESVDVTATVLHDISRHLAALSERDRPATAYPGEGLIQLIDGLGDLMDLAEAADEPDVAVSIGSDVERLELRITALKAGQGR